MRGQVQSGGSGSSGHAFEAVVFVRGDGGLGDQGDKSGGSEEQTELMISCGGALAKGRLLEGRKGAINDEV